MLTSARVRPALAFLVVLLIALGGAAQAQVAPASAAPEAESFRVSVNVDLVVVHATVRDRNGRVVTDLRKEQFEVYEDGVRQAVRVFKHEDIPVTVGLVVDHSGSMRGKLADVVAAARTFAKSSNPEDEMFVVNFNEKVSPPTTIRFTNRSDELADSISRAPATGETALYDAVGKALERVQGGSRDKKVLVVISDGGDNASVLGQAAVLKMAEQSSALVYAIGIFDAESADRNPKVLRRLARATGGEAFFPGRRDEVVPICERIAREIRNQYTIGYVSAGADQPGAYRTIRVVAGAAGHGKLSVRARAGYMAAQPRPANVAK